MKSTTTERPTRMFDLLDDRELMMRYVRFIDHKAPVTRREVKREHLRRRSEWLSYALLHRGVQRGEGVGIVCGARVECAYINMGIMQIGATPILLDTNLTAEQYLSLLGNVRVLVVENGEVYQHFRLIFAQLQHLRLVLSIEPVEGELSVADFIEEGRLFADEEALLRRKNLVTTDDVCMYEYRGGAGYMPWLHRNLIERVVCS